MKPIWPFRNEHGEGRGVGRRKTAHCLVYSGPGNGKITINGQDWLDFMPRARLRQYVMEPIIAAELLNQVNVRIKVKGGGFNGQAEAMRIGVAKSLANFEPGSRYALKRSGMMNRDPRMVERKKPGLKKARKRRQWVKR
eukprot:TRINITY_DN3465_c2_g2_i1.p1 TRINITY_DN3465_c2_g2~~TRINITY_DN3465_c2_g2_i1.p1  ORF type:complete len:139 (+),score=33.41 TRINITY_DN3465_c2_g2_i1:535-951(+)